jgi:hypothetical protein
MSWGWEDHFSYVRIKWVKVKGLWKKNSQVKVFVLSRDVNYGWKYEFQMEFRGIRYCKRILVIIG